MRFSRTRTLTAAVAAGIMVAVAMTAPAFAADRQRGLRNKEFSPADLGTGIAGSASEAWLRNVSLMEIFTIEDKGTYDSQPQVKIQNGYGRCLDSRGNHSSESAWFLSCNSGDYQLWQIFTNGNGTKTYKNKGAWTQQGRHLCLASSGVNRAVIMQFCGLTTGRQQWTEIAP
ncbi:ricin-type beta-trefoil lectin domain protein [Amorphoplanes digitatis]|uniref:Ricin B lectin domain-containing protein n=1 Tax=Actinoplanes digitatis TaxID=1868 RepID=A0A7W7MNS8_9ACTN|nr:RICIN domain-containing protein [Actinoplanes digitatis]MBB4760850.1 hypothetical protein [Actinoplanes digitatis]GID97946.1 hypothetical protein Adi01nite_73580 [Actinoplanes digitatis]